MMSTMSTPSPKESVARRLAPTLTLLFLASLMALPLIVTDTYSLHFIWKVLFWAAIAAAWNIAGGYAGLFSLGHAAFFGLGAYTSILLYMQAGVSPWIGMIVGGLVALCFSLAIGLLTLRLRGSFFALATIAFAEVLRIAVVNGRDVTGGSEGLSVSFAPGLINMIFQDRASYVVLMAAVLFVIGAITLLIERSALGYSLAAMHEDEDAAEALGIDTIRVKLIAIAISAFLSAVTGTLYAFYILLIEPTTVLGIGFSVEIALIAIIGGYGNSSWATCRRHPDRPTQRVSAGRIRCQPAGPLSADLWHDPHHHGGVPAQRSHQRHPRSPQCFAPRAAPQGCILTHRGES